MSRRRVTGLICYVHSGPGSLAPRSLAIIEEQFKKQACLSLVADVEGVETGDIFAILQVTRLCLAYVEHAIAASPLYNLIDQINMMHSQAPLGVDMGAITHSLVLQALFREHESRYYLASSYSCTRSHRWPPPPHLHSLEHLEQ